MTTLASPIQLPHSLTDHPDVLAKEEQRRAAAAALADAKARRDALTAERTTEARQADARVVELEAAMRRADAERREIRERVRSEIRDSIVSELQEVLRDMGGHLDQIERLGLRLETFRQFGLPRLPLVPVLLCEVIREKFWQEARTFGVEVAPPDKYRRVRSTHAG
jgi:hypothetical protein